MKKTHEMNTEEDWDNRKLGSSEEHVRKASPDREKALDECLGLQTISIRLQKSLIDQFKKLAKEDGIGYQPYMRQVLMRYVRQVDHDRKEMAKRGKQMLGTRGR